MAEVATKKRTRTRKVLRVNTDMLIQHLKVISTHGLFVQGNEEALKIGQKCFYWQNGNEKTALTLSEVSQQLNKF